MKDTAVKLAVAAICLTAIGPAWNVTIAELADKTDASPTTVFQPELLIQAWGTAVSTLLMGILAYFTRNQPKE